MKHTWSEFKKLYDNEQTARFAFCDMCDKLVAMQYPEFSMAKSADILETVTTLDYLVSGKPPLVYLPKFFTDYVSNSRKGQIRKSFNENQYFLEVNKCSQWILLIPKKFSEEESSWWANWSERILNEYHIKTVLYDADGIFAMLDKFGLTEKYFPDDATKAVIPDSSQGNEQADEQQEDSELFELTDDDLLEFGTEYQDSDTNDIEVAQPVSKSSSQFAKSSSTSATTHLSETFDKLFADLNIKKDALSDAASVIFDKRRNASKVENYVTDYAIDNISAMSANDLIYKARINRNNEQYERALYIYHYIADNNLVPQEKQIEFNEGYALCENMLNYKYKMISGDLLFAQRDFINSSETYFDASKLINLNNEALTKYNEAYGEALLDVGEFSQAAERFSLALQTDSGNKILVNRRDFAIYLEKGNHYFESRWLSWINVFVAPYFYLKARSKDADNNDLKTRSKKLKRKAVTGLILILFIIIVPISLIFIVRNIALCSGADTVAGESSMSPHDIQMQKGDYYFNNISADNPQYIDSALAAYKRAQRYDVSDTLARSKYNQCLNARVLYIEQVKQNIAADSATYFLSMRAPSEGLRLFKYRYDNNDSSKGKFGYVDTLGNLVVAPMFDFDYKKMDCAGESFHNGKALVCVRSSDGTVQYFYIDATGNKVGE